ncbi:hypothetical protein P0E97_002359, partial [Vibrio metschnikovii]|nr:hypothetical protein [Vibrio metschnikovii]
NGRPHKGSHWQNFHHDDNGELTITHYRSSDHDPVLLVFEYQRNDLEAGSTGLVGLMLIGLAGWLRRRTQ